MRSAIDVARRRAVVVPEPSRRFGRAAIVLPALLAVLLYLPVQRSTLLSDDYSLLSAFYPAATPGELVRRVAGMFSHGVGAPSFQYRPVAMATFAPHVAWGGTDPLPWHAVNLALHAANAGLLAALALRIGRGAPGAAGAACAAGVALALFPPAVEAIAWPAARFDALALFFTLVAARFAVASGRMLDAAAVAGLVAFVLALGSKEAGILALPLAGALLWQREARSRGVVRGAFAALPSLLPWIVVAACYFALRNAIFGDAVRFFPGASPMTALASGAFLDNAAGVVPWWPRAFPETRIAPWFFGAVAVLVALGVRASLAQRERAAEFLPLVAAALVAFTILSVQWRWPAHGEGGRVLYAIGAIALLAITVPLRASSRAIRRAAMLASVVLIVSSGALAQHAVARWATAGADMRALIASLERTAATLPTNEYAFVVVPDHLGPVPFARNAQGALLMRPVQPRELSSQLMVQIVPELGQWPALFQRDTIARLMREPLLDVMGTLYEPGRTTSFRLPDRYLCWNARERTLRPVALDPRADAADWNDAWARALATPACSGTAG